MGTGKEAKGILERGVASLTAVAGKLSHRRGFCSTNYFILSQVVITITISLSSDLPALYSLTSLLSVILEDQTKENVGLYISVSLSFETGPDRADGCTFSF